MVDDNKKPRPISARGAFRRGVKIAALPASYAGRTVAGAGKKIAGQPAEAVAAEITARTAQQVFKTLAGLKGGAMKLGQGMSVLEAALPEEIAAGWRDDLTKLQDQADPMPTYVVREILEQNLGADWKQNLVWLDGGPYAAASLGQVHRGTWKDGTKVAVKVQYPGVEQALASDAKQIKMITKMLAPMMPNIDVVALGEEIAARFMDELDYINEGETAQLFADAYAEDPNIIIPNVVAVGPQVLITEWVDSTSSIAHIIKHGTQQQRDTFGQLYADAIFSGPAKAGALHADPHPGNFRVNASTPAKMEKPGPWNPVDAPETGHLAVLDFGSATILPEGKMPYGLGMLMHAANSEDDVELKTILIENGFLKPNVKIDLEQVRENLRPIIEPAKEEKFKYSRAWMSKTMGVIGNDNDKALETALKLNLPAEYALIHRTWIGVTGVLSQLEAEVSMQHILQSWVPGYSE